MAGGQLAWEDGSFGERFPTNLIAGASREFRLMRKMAASNSS
jgi:hypothetical protein